MGSIILTGAVLFGCLWFLIELIRDRNCHIAYSVFIAIFGGFVGFATLLLIELCFRK